MLWVRLIHRSGVSQKTLISLNDVFADVVNGLLFHGEQLLKEDMLEDVPVTSS